jgi:hypothetical protein
MRHTLRAYVTTGVAIAGAGLIAVPPGPSPLPNAQVRAVQLTSSDSADSPLGDGTALVLGPSGIQGQPPEGYVEAVDQLYLAPRGFTGTVEGVATPEGLAPITGVKSLPFDTSEAQGQRILDTDIVNLVHSGQADADNPVVVFGYSQSAVISAQLMSELASQGVPSDDVHFVLVGDESVPNGGSLSTFDIPVGAHPSAPALGLTFTGGQPSDLYPTDVYTNEYDGFADFPRYPALDGPSVLNALLGIVFQHTAYAGLSPEQIADAVQLPTTASDTLTNYYVIPDQYLPLLEPLLLFGAGGKVLYDLLEPDLRILVDLGYGSLTEGFNQGPANVDTPVGFLPADINLSDLLTALVNGAQQGITDAIQDVENPDLSQAASTEMSDALAPVVSAAHAVGFTDATTPSQLTSLPDLLALARNVLSEFANFPISNATLLSSPTDIINDLSGTVSADYATLLPIADTINALFTSLPAEGLSVLTDAIQSGNLTQGIDEVIGGFSGLVPFALAYGVLPPILYAVGGTLLNLIDLIPGVDSSASDASSAASDASSAAGSEGGNSLSDILSGLF